MKKISAIVKDKTILELAEDANKGDLIDLIELVEVDTSYLEEIIESGKDKVYEKKIEEVKKVLEANNNLKIATLNNELKLVKEQKESELKLKEEEVSKKYNETIVKLQNEMATMLATKKSEIESLNSKKLIEIAKINNENLVKYSSLEQKYNMLQENFNNEILKQKMELELTYTKKTSELESSYKSQLQNKDSLIEKQKLESKNDLDKALHEQKDKYDQELKKKEEIINNLERAKARLNVKQTGEDLEAWCDNEVKSYMQNGLFNCTWEKDNKVIKDDGEGQGSKADFIFNIYASEKHEENELLASICLDMKDENPNSKNKKHNADYYFALDNNRNKKNCKYAVLVSNLEMDKPNELPIFKVNKYEDMYVVRPAYLMVFLNMITSLTTRFKNLITSKEGEKIELKTKLEIIEEFDSIKNTYLDKPLEALAKCLNNINKNSEDIKKACKNIDEENDKIKRNYINQIADKINKFEVKLSRNVLKKMNDLNE